MQITYLLKDLSKVADKILSITPKKTLLFYGPMGSGKTTLIKELAKRIGVTDVMSSPTFSIVNEYQLDQDKLFHFDCYRIASDEEAFDFGIEEYLDSGHWNLIEWPEKIKNILPEETTSLNIIINNNGSRTLTINN
ncbi:tRNA (adenosine(37)-N6)-threonylcarbamoyltransferase complex ATPase subunit type 1 TsaE [Ulvibacter antarcticus]|uniref:tRNA threonylcarbamoyladenosine biosynthesis protein TsaE n=1 Tax=Ulvibacter antarcticus TaxID=442714 RepID=A0A3L9ZCT6_9FLAO|nr:tRNA (adenosine(37)-N6)-threonylcarbamoyltransferase complex ATPase subunit type 1 TsaE [Ulvibacter antarcticus]RMA64462.1 tRNA threonylcarbamoyladenosine biosynthesis protein TsaE [Ulvibacter antarcticus]